MQSKREKAVRKLAQDLQIDEENLWTLIKPLDPDSVADKGCAITMIWFFIVVAGLIVFCYSLGS